MFLAFILSILGFSVSAQAQSTLTFKPIADATVKSGSPSSNYGSASSLEVDSSPAMQTYIKFDVQGVSGTVQSAKLRFYVKNASSNGPEVYSTSSTWSESSITYSNKPSSSGSYLDDRGSISLGSYVEYNVLGVVKANGVYSFVLKPDSSDGADFASRESSSPPQLVIVTSGSAGPVADTTPPVVSITSPMDGQTISGVVSITASASDNVGIASVTFRWDGEPFAAPDTSAPYSFSWNTAAMGDDLYTLTAVATDTSGNTTVSPIVVVRVQNAAAPTATPIPTPPPSGSGSVRRVPQDYSSIQAAIDAAAGGDTILVSPGTYSGGLKVTKGITLASLFHSTSDRSYIDSTILSGGAPIVSVTGANAKIIGFTFKGGTKGVQSYAHATVENNKFMSVGNDATSIENTSGVIRSNHFEFPGDDCIDADDPRDILIEGNYCKGADDDGIEIRNYDYTGTLVTAIIRSNTFVASENGDGIQLIDYSGTANRKFIIQRNLLVSNSKAGLGLLDNGDTVQDFRAASMPERIEVTNNTIVGNNHGISGGDNLIAVNNIIANNTVLGIKGADNKSIASYNIFYGNGANYSASNVNTATSKFVSPMLAADYRLQSGSPAIDAGTSSFTHNGELIFSIAAYSGAAPDLGCYESGSAATASATPAPTPVPTATPASTPAPTPVPVATSTTTATPAPRPSGSAYADDTFSSLSSGPVLALSKDFGYTQYRSNIAADGKASVIDIRQSKFIVANSKNANPTYEYDCTQGSLPIQTYPLILDNMDLVSLVGGLFKGEAVPQKSDWRPTYCNSAVVSFRNTPSSVADGIRITGGWDGIRQAEGSANLLIKNTWMTNVRDDGVENDFLNNLTVSDVLMDGVFQGISIRPSSSNSVGDSSAHTVTVTSSIIRLQSYLIEGKYAYGSLFKTRVDGAPKNKVYNSILAVDPDGGVQLSTTNWPQGFKDMVDCRNNLFLWMSDAPMPSSSSMGTIPSCFTVVKGQAARDMYSRAKTNWINCHPQLARGANDPVSDVSQCRAGDYGGL